MNGLKALGHMLVEEGLILAIRQKEKAIKLEYADIVGVAVELMVSPDIFKLEKWELGWECPDCWGSGMKSVPCKCQGRMQDPCCGGENEKPCTRCSGGIKWEDEY